MIKPQSLAGEAQAEDPFRPRTLQHRILGLLLCISLGMGVEWLLFNHRQECAATAKAASTAQNEIVRGRLESELNAVFYLAYGIADTWLLRSEKPDAAMTRLAFADLFRHSRHVQCFAVSLGSQLAYVYPEEDGPCHTSEFGKQIADWSSMQSRAENRNPLLEWQSPPSHGLSFRVPLYADGQLTGLLLTLVDESSLMSAAGLPQAYAESEYALRSLGETDQDNRTIFGPAQLFADPDAQTTRIPVPGGSWELAAKPLGNRETAGGPWLLRIVGWLFAAWLSLSLVILRSLHLRLADLALYDRLTGHLAIHGVSHMESVTL